MDLNNKIARPLLIISDTGMNVRDGIVYAFGPVVKEVEVMLQVFDHITWIGANLPNEKENHSFSPIPNDQVTPILLDTPNSKGLRHKVDVLFHYPSMWHVIKKAVRDHQYIHVRSPSHPAYISMKLSKRYRKKQFWFKYAGSWVDPASKFYDLQRETLKKLPQHCKVTVNGTWKDQPNTIIAFENPCITLEHRKEGNLVIQNKRNDEKPLHYCFVGGLNHNKGIEKLVKAWVALSNESLGHLHVIGNGVLKESLITMSSPISETITFHGLMSKEEVHNMYSKCHFIVLPSKTEGFPKVIGEAMNYGCIPIVSNVSCIDQYIKNEHNGFVLDEISISAIKQSLLQSSTLSMSDFIAYNEKNYKIADRFTYEYYLHRIKTEIFPILMKRHSK